MKGVAIIILIAFCNLSLIAMASIPGETTDFWLDATYGIDSGNGSFEAPFRRVQDFSTYLSNSDLQSGDIRLFIAPGVYTDPILDSLPINIEFLPCERCPGENYDRSDIWFDLRMSTRFWTSLTHFNTSLTIRSIVFSGVNAIQIRTEAVFGIISQSQLILSECELRDFISSTSLIIADPNTHLNVNNAIVRNNSIKSLQNGPKSVFEGIFYLGSANSALSISHSLFQSNIIYSNGGDLQSSSESLQGGVITSSGKISIFDSIFRQNGIRLGPQLLKGQHIPACGGAIGALGPHAWINHTLFESNFVSQNETYSRTTRGGAICLGQFSVLSVEKSKFISNSAGFGGAIATAISGSFQFVDTDPECHLTISNSIFHKNTCSGRGCAIDFSPFFVSSFLEIENSSFTENRLESNNQCNDENPQTKSSKHIQRSMAQYRPKEGLNHTFLSRRHMSSFDFGPSFGLQSNSITNRTFNQVLESSARHSFRVKQHRQNAKYNKSIHSDTPLHTDTSLTTLMASDSSVDANSLSGGVAISVMGFSQYFSLPHEITFSISGVTFHKNDMKDSCQVYGSAVLLNKVSRVGMENVLFQGHWSEFADSVISMKQVSRIVANSVALIDNHVNWRGKGRVKISVWKIEGEGALPSPSSGELDIFDRVSSRKKEDTSSGILYQKILEAAPFESPKALHQIHNLTLVECFANDALFHCVGANSIQLTGSHWRNISLPLTSFSPSLLWIRSMSSNVYIEDCSVDIVDMPIVIAYIGEAVVLKNSSFSGFSGSQTSFVNLYQASSVNISDCIWNSNEATGLLVSSSKTAIYDSTFIDNNSNVYSGGAQFSSSDAYIGRCNFTKNRGANGGALTTNSALNIFQSLFEQNKATNGGAIMIVSSPSVIVESTNCTGNFAFTRGGCIAVSSDNTGASASSLIPPSQGLQRKESYNESQKDGKGTEIVSRFNLFDSNEASNGGAVSLYGSIYSQFNDTTFLSNTAYVQGGGIEIWSPLLFSGISYSQPVQRIQGMVPTHHLNRCEFKSNNAQDFLGNYSEKARPTPPSFTLQPTIGGAILVHQAELTSTECIFDSNTAEYSGGAIYGANILRTGLKLLSTSFKSNRAYTSGGAIFIGEQAIQTIVPNYTYCHLSIKDAIFDSNFANYGGAFSWVPSGICSNNQLNETDAYLENVLFSHNNAKQSGGAVYFTGNGYSHFYSYNNLTMDSNTANMSGNHFFYNHVPREGISKSKQWQEAQNTPIFCLPNLCRIQQPPRNGAYWGDIFASSFWSIQYDLEPLNQILWVRPLSLQYCLVDLYHQQVTEPLLLNADILPLSAAEDQLRDEDEIFEIAASNDPDSGMIFNGFTDKSLIVSLGVGQKYARDPLIGFRQDPSNPFVSPVKVSAVVRLSPSSYASDQNAFFLTDQAMETEVYRCGVGFGLWKLPGSNSLFGCMACPIGTYNFNGDGQCYSCHGESIQLNCQTDSVSALTGFWAYSPRSSYIDPSSTDQNLTTPISETLSNELLIAKCRTGQCLSGKCSEGRSGVMCSRCVDGSWETLFSYCSSELCRHPSVVFYILLALVLVVGTFLFHFFVNCVPVNTIHLSSSIFIGIMLLQHGMDWGMPQAMIPISSVLCGFRATAIQRMLFFSFMPYTMIPLLSMVCIIIHALQCTFKCFGFNWLGLAAKQVSGLKVLKSICGLFIVLSVPSLKNALDWTQCTKFENRWVFSPSVLCASEPFKNARISSLSILIPSSIVPIALVCGSIMFELRQDPKKLRWTKTLNFVVHLVSNHISRPFSRFCTMVDLIGKLVIGVIYAVTAQEENLRALILASLFVLLMMFHALGSPFMTNLERISGTSSYAVLAVIAVAEPNFFRRSWYSLVAFGGFLTGMIIITIGFVIGRRKALTKQAYQVEDEKWEDLHPNLPTIQTEDDITSDTAPLLSYQE